MKIIANKVKQNANMLRTQDEMHNNCALVKMAHKGEMLVGLVSIRAIRDNKGDGGKYLTVEERMCALKGFNVIPLTPFNTGY